MNAIAFNRPLSTLGESRLFYRSASGATRFRAKHGQSIDIDVLAQAAPSIFAAEKHDSRSARYTYIDTADVLTKLLEEGFVPVAVQQGGSRVEGKRDFTKHQINFRHRNWFDQAPAERHVGMVFPEVSLRNSHDGTSAYVLSMDVFRLVCLNGMTVSDGVIESFKVPHKGNVGDQIIEGAFKVIDRVPELVDDMSVKAALELSARERLAFATAARELRWSSNDDGQPPIDPSRLLEVRRAADRGDSLWNTMQVAQEHLVRGGDSYQRVTRNPDTGQVRRQQRTVGEVRNLDEANRLNRALYTLADEMAKLKAA